MRPASLLSILGPLMLVQAVHVPPVVREAAVIADVVEGSDPVVRDVAVIADVVEDSNDGITGIIDARSNPLRWIGEAQIDDCKFLKCGIALGLPACAINICTASSVGITICIVSLFATIIAELEPCDHCAQAARNYFRNMTAMNLHAIQLDDLHEMQLDDMGRMVVVSKQT